MTRIYFTKVFTSGLLKGLAVIDSVTYPTVAQCAKTIFVGKKGKDCLTKNRWTITDVSYQNYRRY